MSVAQTWCATGPWDPWLKSLKSIPFKRSRVILDPCCCSSGVTSRKGKTEGEMESPLKLPRTYRDLLGRIIGQVVKRLLPQRTGGLVWSNSNGLGRVIAFWVYGPSGGWRYGVIVQRCNTEGTGKGINAGRGCCGRCDRTAGHRGCLSFTWMERHY